MSLRKKYSGVRVGRSIPDRGENLRQGRNVIKPKICLNTWYANVEAYSVHGGKKGRRSHSKRCLGTVLVGSYAYDDKKIH